MNVQVEKHTNSTTLVLKEGPITIDALFKLTRLKNGYFLIKSKSNNKLISPSRDGSLSAICDYDDELNEENRDLMFFVDCKNNKNESNEKNNEYSVCLKHISNDCYVTINKHEHFLSTLNVTSLSSKSKVASEQIEYFKLKKLNSLASEKKNVEIKSNLKSNSYYLECLVNMRQLSTSRGTIPLSVSTNVLESFKFEQMSNGYFCIKCSANNKYLWRNENFELVASRNAMSENDFQMMFDIKFLAFSQNIIVIKSLDNDKYLTVSPASSESQKRIITASADDFDEFEMIKLIKKE